MRLELPGGRTLGVSLAWFPRLLHATPEQRNRYEISGGGEGLHWVELDDDISLPALLAGQGDHTRGAIAAKQWHTGDLGHDAAE